MSLATRLRDPKPVVNDAALYFGDNDRLYCGEHLGMTARFTGRDLSGQPIEEVTPTLLAAARATPEGADWIRCERCGKTPSALYRADS